MINIVERKENDDLAANSIIKLEDQLTKYCNMQTMMASDLSDGLTMDNHEHPKQRARRSERPDGSKVNALKKRIERLSKKAKQSAAASLLERQKSNS